MNQERYWRNLIADEIKAEHDKVKTYYQKRGMNSGGMSSEEHTRLNIFLLCESISRTMRNTQDAPRNIDTPDSIPEISPKPIKEIVQEAVIEDIPEPLSEPLPEPVQDIVQNLVKDTPYQNEFGELL